MNKILKHISFARDWLERAERKLRSGSLVDGEVYLSLAESEIRKAWESSYDARKKQRAIPIKKRQFSLAIGIVLILVFVIVGSNYFYNPVQETEQFKLSLIEGYRNRNDLYSEGQQMRLINVNFMIDSNYDRGNQSGS